MTFTGNGFCNIIISLNYLPLFSCILITCGNPESFVRGGPTLITFFCLCGEGGSKYHYKRVIIGPPAKGPFKKTFRLQADDDPPLNAGLVAL